MENKNNKKEKSEGYPPYPKEEDIVYNAEKVALDPKEPKTRTMSDKKLNEDASLPEERIIEDGPAQKEMNRIYNDETDDEWSEENFDEVHTGDDLDVPGSGADDEMEDIGSEDEENNYYSLGGDRKED